MRTLFSTITAVAVFLPSVALAQHGVSAMSHENSYGYRNVCYWESLIGFAKSWKDDNEKVTKRLSEVHKLAKDDSYLIERYKRVLQKYVDTVDAHC